MKILFLTRYDSQGASSRLRSYQFIPELKYYKIEAITSPFIDNSLLLNKYTKGKYSFLSLIKIYLHRIKILNKLNNYDLIWIEKEALPWLPIFMEKWFLRNSKYILDFDDAIFHNYDQHNSFLIRFFLGLRIDKLMKDAQLVICGNQYLADRAIKANCKHIEIIPTVIDLSRYIPKQNFAIVTVPIIVWIGSPSSLQYLVEISDVFKSLSQKNTFKLRIIGGGDIEIPGVTIETLPWTLDTEVNLISECDIGIMPLRNTPWEQGKCAYKLIQYMACGLPTVASPVGENNNLLINNENGFLPATDDAWIDKLDLLLSNKELREQFGKVGRKMIETKYCTQQITPKLVDLFEKVNTNKITKR